MIVFCSGTDISAAVQRIGVKFCVMVEMCRGRVFSPFDGDIFSGLHSKCGFNTHTSSVEIFPA